MRIPRLELMAALLAARFAEDIIKQHDIKFDKKLFWCDSATVLKWLNADPLNYKQFVSIPVGQIQEKTNVNNWRWISSRNNVADEATKWVEFPKIESNTRWYKGPEFLYLPEDQWPEEKFINKIPTNEELRVHTTLIDIKSLIEQKSKLFKLSPYLDDDGMLRKKDRIDVMPNITEYQKRPIILHRENKITNYALP